MLSADNQISQPTTQASERIEAQEPIAQPDEDFADLPVIDLNLYLEAVRDKNLGKEFSEEAQAECDKVLECLHKYGVLIIRDPRVNFQDNEDYIDLMEKYFERTGELFYTGEKVDDIKPECHYQVGATPEFIEQARDHSELRKSLNMALKDQPDSPMTPVLDAKWRFFWKIGERPEGAADDFPAVMPAGFPDWEEKMNKWGVKLHSAVDVVAEMAALGFKLPADTFTSRMKGGAHLLAPTGSDLEKNDTGAIFAGFHYDIALLTIHGKSRYPGLSVWTRDWKKRTVKLPKGCLLVQAGATFEHITGGYVLAGFHEVVYTEATKRAFLARKLENEKNNISMKQWRVSSTLFSHFRNDVDVTPMTELAHLYTPEDAKKYQVGNAFDLLMQELTATGMAMQ